ncbi:hypothetical protein RCIP0075_00043 [Klebsiella phage RCIP0075]
MNDFSTADLRVILDMFSNTEAFHYLEQSEEAVRAKVLALLEQKLAE